jgi:hypothetical protein
MRQLNFFSFARPFKVFVLVLKGIHLKLELWEEERSEGLDLFVQPVGVFY